MKASDLFIECLENEGVKHIFGMPGEETISIMGSLIDSKIEFLLTRHEQAAAFMADIHGRLTGKAGVCLSTLGPGATNLITGVANANLDKSPIVAITAQAGRERMHKESHQYIDLVKMFHPVTKWNISIRSAQSIPELVRKSFRIAEMEKPGSVHIEVPEDVADSTLEHEAPLPVKSAPIYHPDKSELERAAEEIRKAEHPMILVGNGVIRANASRELIAFAEANNIPVVNTFMSKGVIPHDNDLSLFTIGLQVKDYALCTFDKADVVIAVGYDFVEYSPYKWNPHKDKKIIHIDSRRSEVDSFYSPSVELIGDIKLSLGKLKEETGFDKKYEYASRIRKLLLEEFSLETSAHGMPVKPQRIIKGIREAIGKEDIVVSDVGMHKLWVARFFPTYTPNTVLISNGLASMGFGLPGGIAAKLAKPDKKVVVVTGDGGFMMNSQEIETAKRFGTDLTIVLFRDGKLGSIEMKQKQRELKKEIGIVFGNPDFVKYAESFGANGFRVEKADETEDVIKEAVRTKGVNLVEIPVDYSENHKLINRLGTLSCPI